MSSKSFTQRVVDYLATTFGLSVSVASAIFPVIPDDDLQRLLYLGDGVSIEQDVFSGVHQTLLDMEGAIGDALSTREQARREMERFNRRKGKYAGIGTFDGDPDEYYEKMKGWTATFSNLIKQGGSGELTPLQQREFDADALRTPFSVHNRIYDETMADFRVGEAKWVNFTAKFNKDMEASTARLNDMVDEINRKCGMNLTKHESFKFP